MLWLIAPGRRTTVLIATSSLARHLSTYLPARHDTNPRQRVGLDLFLFCFLFYLRQRLPSPSNVVCPGSTRGSTSGPTPGSTRLDSMKQAASQAMMMHMLLFIMHYSTQYMYTCSTLHPPHFCFSEKKNPKPQAPRWRLVSELRQRRTRGSVG